MRRFLFLAIGFCFFRNAFAQNPEDVVKNAWFVPNGTARSMSVGGAIGALGGDITSVSVNPAGLGFYKTREVVLSPSFLFNNNQSDYRGTSTDNIKRSAFQLGTTGVVFGGRINNANNTSAFS